MLVLAEIAVVIVYVAALVAACSCFAYLVILAVRERHLRPGLIGVAPQAVPELAAERRSVATQARGALLHRV